MKPDKVGKDNSFYIRKLEQLAGGLENGELSFIFFQISETPGESHSTGRLILHYKVIPGPEELPEDARRAEEALRGLVATLEQGAEITNFREEYEPVRGMEYSQLAETNEYGGYQRLVVEWEQ